MIQTTAGAQVELQYSYVFGNQAYASSYRVPARICGQGNARLKEYKFFNSADKQETGPKFAGIDRPCHTDRFDMILAPLDSDLSFTPIPETVSLEEWKDRLFTKGLPYNDGVRMACVETDDPDPPIAYRVAQGIRAGWDPQLRALCAIPLFPGSTLYDITSDSFEMNTPFVYKDVLYTLTTIGMSDWGYTNAWGRTTSAHCYIHTQALDGTTAKLLSIGCGVRSSGLPYCSLVRENAYNWSNCPSANMSNLLTAHIFRTTPGLADTWNCYTETRSATQNQPSGEDCEYLYTIFKQYHQCLRENVPSPARAFIYSIIDSCIVDETGSQRYRLITDSAGRNAKHPYPLLYGNGADEPRLPRSVLSRWNRMMRDCAFMLPIESDPDWGKLASDCVDQLSQMDINIIANLLEIRQVGQSTIGLYSFLTEGADNLKELASVWLSQKYGDRLTVADARTLYESLTSNLLDYAREEDWLVTRSRYTANLVSSLPYVVDQRQTVCYKCRFLPKDYNVLMKGIRVLADWGLWLDLQNAWDILPMSFVLDWFVSISDILNNTDRILHSTLYDVSRIVRSSKTFTVLDPALFTIPEMEEYGVRIASLTHTRYDREVTHQLDSLKLDQVSLSLPDIPNIIDGIALLLQR